MLKRLKLLYAIYNFFHKKELVHNLRHYQRLGLRKNYFSPVCSTDFNNLKSNSLPGSVKTTPPTETALYKKANQTSQQSIRNFDENGFLILKNYFSTKTVNEINTAIEQALDNKQLKFQYRNKIMFAIHKIPLLKQIVSSKEFTKFLSSLIQGEAVLFQSINFLNGSEQKTHSDSIHMTTFPLGGLLGVWIALDDIAEDNGALHYYPGSHKLPYYLNPDFNNEGNSLFLGNKDYTQYEKMIADKIKEHSLPKKILTATKGDVLVWHANLLHGGEPHLNKNKTRKSMVLHYFDNQRICYHEISQRPALFKNFD